MTDKTNNAHKLNGGSPHTLEGRVVATLNDPDVTSADLVTLISDVEQGIIDAGIIEDRLQQVVLDPLQSPDLIKAKEAAEFAQLVVRRLETVLPRLRSKHQQVVTEQRAARWNTLADLTQTNREVLVAELTEVYPQWIDKIIALFQHVQAMDQEIDHVNGLAPNSVSRRLLPIDTARIAANTKLVDLSGQQVWPPPVAAILPQQVMQAPPHPGKDWAQAIDQRNRARNSEAERVAAYYKGQQVEREQREADEAKAARARNGASP